MIFARGFSQGSGMKWQLQVWSDLQVFGGDLYENNARLEAILLASTTFALKK